MTCKPIKQLDYTPDPPSRVNLRLTRPGERAVRQGHPWIFEQAVTDQNKPASAGDLAVIYDNKRKFLAVGLYDPHSPIRVRVLASGKPTTIDADWFNAQFQQAADLRSTIDQTQTNGYRLIHGENDGLPGLIIDRYDRTAVIKLYTAAWIAHLPTLLICLNNQLDLDTVVLRLGRAVAEQTETLRGLYDGQTIAGKSLDNTITFRENSIIFEVDPIAGQKTGFFLDQRENRQRVEMLAKGKTALNVFAYNGGFSLYAARGGATQVTSLDISPHAMVSALRNFELNQCDPNIAAATHETITGDAFQVMEQMADGGRRFDLTIVDPPAFASSNAHVEKALGAYRQLARLAANVTHRGGTLVSASCSSRVTQNDFFDAVQRGVTDAGRRLNAFNRTDHAVDHPIGFKEGAYLKCLYATIH